MEPQQLSPTPNPAPEQPSPPPVASAALGQSATPATNPMPPSSAPVGEGQPAAIAPTPPTGLGIINVEKDKKKALWLGIASIVIFVIGFLFGFAALVGVALGAWAIKLARPAKAKTGLTLGIIGLVLNAALMLLVLLVG